MTTTPQTEAKRLADELEDMTCTWSPSDNRDKVNCAAIELRRLDAENSDLRERNAALGNAQEIALDTATEHALAADELRSALTAAEAERDQLRAQLSKAVASKCELLEALRQVLDEQDWNDGYTTSGAYYKARAAITKATGEHHD